MDCITSIAGIKIFTRTEEIEVYNIKRTWKERLFTSPWSPLVKTKIWIDEGAVERNKEAYNLNGNIYMTTRMYEELKKDLYNGI